MIVLVGVIAGCKPRSQDTGKAPGQPKPKAGEYFQTHFQDESQFIVENIAADLAEMIYFAKHQQLPDAKKFSVAAAETSASSFGKPVYGVQLVLDGKASPIEAEISVDGPIWSGGVYVPFVASVAQSVGLEPAVSASAGNDVTLLRALTKATAEVIEEENLSLSAALESSFLDPALHEKAALLLAAFTLREHSGEFMDIRWPMGRIAAHLAFARFLAGDQAVGINGQIANAALETLVNNQANALRMLAAIKSSDPV
jgi:hypothetical protein